MKPYLSIALISGIFCILPACKTRSNFASASTGSAFAAFGAKKQAEEKPESDLKPAVIGLVGQDQVEQVSFSASDVMESNPGTTLIASNHVAEQMNIRTTAYCHLEADSIPYGTKCADGSELKFGQVRSAAADWSRYPVGTRFKIKGMPYEYIVDDYGSALVGSNTIDLYKPTFTQMNQWGVREVPIEVIKWGCYERSRKILAGRVKKPCASHVREMHDAIVEKRVSHRVKPAPMPKLPPVGNPTDLLRNDTSA